MRFIVYSDYIIFVDESGDHSLTSINQDYPVFVLCFCIINKETYINTVVPSIQRLKIRTFGHDQIIIHEHDLRRKKKAFSRLNKEARDEFMAKLSAIMEETDLTIISVVIDKIQHKIKYNYPIHPYHLALMFGLERLYDFMRINDQAESLTHIIFERRGTKEDEELELEFRRVCGGSNRSGKTLPFEIVLAHKQSNASGLQLADITARPVGLSVFRPQQANQAMEIIKKKFFRGRHNCIEGNGLKVFP